MPTSRTARRAAAVLACAAFTPTAPTAAAARVTPLCTTVAAAGSTVFCAGQARDVTGHPRDVRVFRSADAGRTWVRAGGVTYAPNDPQALLVALAVSPRYATDRALLLQTSRALHVSTDSGATFRVLDPLGGGQYADALATAVVQGRPVALNATPVYDTTGASATDLATGAHLPGLAPDAAVLRYLPTGDGVTAVARAADGALGIVACALPPTCTETVGRLPAGATYAGGGPLGTGAYVVTREAGVPRAWVHGDGRYHRWPAVDALTRAAARLPGAAAEVRVAAAPDRAGTYYALVTHRSASAAVPASQLFVSTDAGAHWRRTAYGRSRRQGGRALLPWNAPVRGAPGGGWQLAALPGGRLVVVAADEPAAGRYAYEGPFCSRDAGRSWARAC